MTHSTAKPHLNDLPARGPRPPSALSGLALSGLALSGLVLSGLVLSAAVAWPLGAGAAAVSGPDSGSTGVRAVADRGGGDVSGDCVVRHSDAPGMSGRTSVIRFPDGREITIVGHNHGNRNQGGNEDTLLSILNDPVASRTNQEFRETLSYQLEQQQEATQESKQDTAFLRAYLTKHSDAKFIGAEMRDGDVAKYIQNEKGMAANLHHQIEERKLKPSPDDVNVITLTYGATFYLKNTEPGLFKGRAIVGYEDPAAGQAFIDADRAQHEAGEALLRKTFVNSAAINQFLASISPRYPTYDPAKDDAKIFAEASSKLSRSDVVGIAPYLKSQLRVMAIMKQRDRADAANIVAQSASGVMFIGANHLASITEMIRQKCLNGDGSSARSPKARLNYDTSNISR